MPPILNAFQIKNKLKAEAPGAGSAEDLSSSSRR